MESEERDYCLVMDQLFISSNSFEIRFHPIEKYFCFAISSLSTWKNFFFFFDIHTWQVHWRLNLKNTDPPACPVIVSLYHDFRPALR